MNLTYQLIIPSSPINLEVYKMQHLDTLKIQQICLKNLSVNFSPKKTIIYSKHNAHLEISKI